VVPLGWIVGRDGIDERGDKQELDHERHWMPAREPNFMEKEGSEAFKGEQRYA
jgi:hypothetical protein